MEPTSAPAATSSVAEQEEEETYTAKATSSSPPGASSYRQAAEKRKRRNTGALVQWIEEHPYNPYPTKAEKQNLAYTAGMTLRQLNDWFANARRNIKKLGLENWRKKRNGTNGGTGGGAAGSPRLTYGQTGGYSLNGVVPPNYLVTNQALHGMDFRGMFGTATTPATPAFGSLSAVPTPAGLHPNHHGSLMFSDRQSTTGLHQTQPTRQCAMTSALPHAFFSPTAGYSNGTPQAAATALRFQPAPCAYGQTGPLHGQVAGIVTSSVIDQTAPTHAHFSTPWQMSQPWLLGGCDRVGQPDESNTTSPENHCGINGSAPSSSANSS